MHHQFMPTFYFILVEPAVPENTGAAARAIKTMGFNNLRLVNPSEFPGKKAEILAHGAKDVLNNAEIHKTLFDAIHDIDLVIGTTAKRRSVHHDYYDANETVGLIRKKESTISTAGIVFGREEAGLSNDELKLCHLVSYLPVKIAYPSLNLAQAVMLYAYLFSEVQEYRPVSENKPATGSEYAIIREKASQLLASVGFEPGSNIFNRFMERIAAAGQDDIHLMLSFINKLSIHTKHLEKPR